MPDELAHAQAFANRFRYSEDSAELSNERSGKNSDQLNHYLSHSSLKLSVSLTPDIFVSFEQACRRLQMGTSLANAYVYSSAEIQAACFAESSDHCLIQLSSSVIELMSPEELQFVIGHEFGHFLLGHNLGFATGRQNVEHFMQSRNQEISADRLGLVACQDLETAIRALMKTTSGLSDHHLRFDVGAFLGQIRKSGETEQYLDEFATHPSLVLRCRALLWFSMSEKYFTETGETGGEDQARIDGRIRSDLERHVDAPAKQRIDEACNDLRIWLSAYASVRDGVLSRDEQESIGRLVGKPTLEKLLNFYTGHTREEVDELTREKLREAIRHLEQVAPSHLQNALTEICAEVETEFKQSDFAQHVMNFLGQDR